MDTSNNARKPNVRAECVCYVDLFGGSTSLCFYGSRDVVAKGFTELAEALESGDIARKDQVLRRWGVRR